MAPWSNDRGHKLLSHYRLSADATRRIPRRRFLHWLWPKRLLPFLKVLLRDKDGCYAGLNGKGAFVSESALHSFDGDKPNSVGVIAHADDHSSHPPRGCGTNARRTFLRHGATIPEDFIGPAALPLFCLAPHGVFRASRIAPRAVSSYLAFSPLPALLSKNRRCVFCDTFRRRNFSTATPAYFTRHAAVWCSDFPPVSLAAHQRSSAIG